MDSYARMAASEAAAGTATVIFFTVSFLSSQSGCALMIVSFRA